MASSLFEVDDEELFSDPLSANLSTPSPSPAPALAPKRSAEAAAVSAPALMSVVDNGGDKTAKGNIFEEDSDDDSFDAMIIKAQAKQRLQSAPAPSTAPSSAPSTTYTSSPTISAPKKANKNPLALTDSEEEERHLDAEPEPELALAPPTAADKRHALPFPIIIL